MSENNERKEQHVNETPKSHPVAKPVVKKKKKKRRIPRCMLFWRCYCCC